MRSHSDLRIAFIYLVLALNPLALAAQNLERRLLPDGVIRFERTSATPSFLQRLSLWAFSESLPFGKSIAFLVGVGKYSNLEPPLDYVSSDVLLLKDFLLAEGGFDAVYIALDDVATASRVDNYMMNFFVTNLSNQDRLLFYFSGHGADLNDQVTGYMQFGRAVADVYDRDQYLEINKCRIWSARIPAKHILFLFDACNSGLGFDSKSDDLTRC